MGESGGPNLMVVVAQSYGSGGGESYSSGGGESYGGGTGKIFNFSI